VVKVEYEKANVPIIKVVLESNLYNNRHIIAKKAIKVANIVIRDGEFVTTISPSTEEFKEWVNELQRLADQL
jgi:uncharacterized protein YdaT